MYDLHFMDRRFLVIGAAGCLLFWTASAIAATKWNSQEKRIHSDGVEFSWYFRKQRLHAQMAAPTNGWLAIGFNSSPGLKNAYFVMMRMENGRFQSSERISSGFDHAAVGELGLPSVLIDGSGKSDVGKTSVSIHLPARLPGPANIRLTEGSETHIMLAWSQSGDFSHHSTWRRHFRKTL
ncbi:DOMON domain-containing protein [uncultured Roseibium sp.]|uniref:DOMON domain-containing protein n=1 Tax=uncultured Roseibium sp. TaxID=1936171 RepID=UPI0026244B42|nr:DOMON domain-containing protein [uncultured Roseibium sp.]